MGKSNWKLRQETTNGSQILVLKFLLLTVNLSFRASQWVYRWRRWWKKKMTVLFFSSAISRGKLFLKYFSKMYISKGLDNLELKTETKIISQNFRQQTLSWSNYCNQAFLHCCLRRIVVFCFFFRQGRIILITQTALKWLFHDKA